MVEERIIVMNGYAILQQVINEVWTNKDVFKAREIKPKVYNLSESLELKKALNKAILLYAKDNKAFLFTSTGAVVHVFFDKTPTELKKMLGCYVKVIYNNDCKFDILAAKT